jgi:hypothetical protein
MLFLLDAYLFKKQQPSGWATPHLHNEMLRNWDAFGIKMTHHKIHHPTQAGELRA